LSSEIIIYLRKQASQLDKLGLTAMMISLQMQGSEILTSIVSQFDVKDGTCPPGMRNDIEKTRVAFRNARQDPICSARARA